MRRGKQLGSAYVVFRIVMITRVRFTALLCTCILSFAQMVGLGSYMVGLVGNLVKVCLVSSINLLRLILFVVVSIT